MSEGRRYIMRVNIPQKYKLSIKQFNFINNVNEMIHQEISNKGKDFKGAWLGISQYAVFHEYNIEYVIRDGWTKRELRIYNNCYENEKNIAIEYLKDYNDRDSIINNYSMDYKTSSEYLEQIKVHLVEMLNLDHSSMNDQNWFV